MLKVEGISKSFKKTDVLNNLSFDFENKTYGILGPNGSGKTTLMRCITGVYNCRGKVSIDGKSTEKCYVGKKFSIGYLPQRFGLFKELRLDEMMAYLATQRGISRTRQQEEIDNALELVNLSEEKKKRVGALSGGMLRRAGIAQAMLGDPKCIILDEPTAGLDPEECMRFRTTIAQIKKDRTILISTHIVEDIETTCDEIIIMDKGKFVFSGTANALCAVAGNEVYDIEKQDAGRLLGTYFVEKESLINNVAKMRVISSSRQEFKPVEPNVEDGYLCCLKNI
ncbi:MAG: ATP-binding cassette domain-containing protein [Acutalibacteraceae bacterium]